MNEKEMKGDVHLQTQHAQDMWMLGCKNGKFWGTMSSKPIWEWAIELYENNVSFRNGWEAGIRRKSRA